MIDLDLIFMVVALLIAWIAQTKASAITAAEFVASIITMTLIMSLGINTPFMWLIFTAYSFCAAYFHVICTANPAIVTGFVLAMLYNLGMAYDWSLIFWSGHNTGIFEEHYAVIMPLIVLWQLLSTAAFGGLKDGIDRWRHNLSDRNNPYLCVAQGDTK